MMMKKITAGLLALTIAAGAATTAFADNTETAKKQIEAMTAYSEITDSRIKMEAEGVSTAPKLTASKQADGSVRFEWEKVDGIDGYLLYRNGSKGYEHHILRAETTSFVWEDFDPDYTYGLLTYINVDGDTIKSPVTEINGSDIKESGASDKTGDVSAPAVPIHVRTGIGKTALRLYWQPAPCDGVEVYMSDGAGMWQLKGTSSKGDNNLRIEGLTPGTNYYFKMRAFNLASDGSKVYSDYTGHIAAATAAAPVTVKTPDVPKYTKTGRGKNALRLYWEALECDGVEVYMNDGEGMWVLQGTAAKGVTNYRVAGLKPGTTYYFKLRSFNTASDGSKVYSDYTGHIAAATTGSSAPEVKAPDVPKYVKTGLGKTALRLYWEALECDGVEVYITRDGTWQLAGTSAKGVNNYRVEGLLQGTTYYFKMRAFNLKPDGSKVYSDYTGNIASTTKGTALPAKPDQVTLKGIGKSTNAIRVYWNAQKCSGYEIYIYKDNKWLFVGNAGADDTNYRITGLSPNTVYYVTVRAFNTNGTDKVFGEFSANKKVTTLKQNDVVVTAPPVVNVTKISKGKTAVRLRWDKLDCDGYEVYRKVSGNYVLAATVGKDADNYRFEGLTPNTAYYFRIRAFRLKADGSKVFGEFGKNYKATTLADPNAGPKIEVKNGVTYVNGILIANKTYALPSNYNPGGLTSETAAAFAKLQQAAKQDGIYLWCASGFRSYGYQQSLYNNYVARDGKAAADRYSARPGHSEHQTGLALDVNNPSSDFNNTAEAKWLAAHCAEYGFILRYPQGKEYSTGFMYESWHIRYLGVDLAKKVTASGKTLEEYLGITSVYNY